MNYKNWLTRDDISVQDKECPWSGISVYSPPGYCLVKSVSNLSDYRIADNWRPSTLEDVALHALENQGQNATPRWPDVSIYNIQGEVIALVGKPVHEKENTQSLLSPSPPQLGKDIFSDKNKK